MHKRLFQPDGVREISEGDQGRAVGQKRKRKRHNSSIRTLDDRGAVKLFGRGRCHRARNGVPDPVTSKLTRAHASDLIEMRTVGQIFRREPPGSREGAVVELEPSVGSEYGDALLQRVERGLLDLDERVIGALLTKALAHIFEEVEKAAGRLPSHIDAQGCAVGKVPELLLFLTEAWKQLQPVALPGGEVALFRQLAKLAQAIEDLALGRAAVEPAFRQPE